MKDIIAFVDALFKLESKNVFSIIGLQEDNREKLRLSLEHCRHLSQNLDELFQFTDVSCILHILLYCKINNVDLFVYV